MRTCTPASIMLILSVAALMVSPLPIPVRANPSSEFLRRSHQQETFSGSEFAVRRKALLSTFDEIARKGEGPVRGDLRSGGFLYYENQPAQDRQAGTQLTETEIYSGSRTVIDLTAAELLKTYPDELGDLDPAVDQQELDTLLHKVGESVEKFFQDLPNTISKEQIHRERLKSDGTLEESVTQNHTYSAQLDRNTGWKEARTDAAGREIPPALMSGQSFLTIGFVSASLYFHPKHQEGCRFRYLGRQRNVSRK